MVEWLVAMGIVLLIVLTLLICVLIRGIRDIIGQVLRANERLLIAVVTSEDNEAVGRALVASSRQPVKPLGGLSDLQEPKKKDKKVEESPGLRITMGAN